MDADGSHSANIEKLAENKEDGKSNIKKSKYTKVESGKKSVKVLLILLEKGTLSGFPSEKVNTNININLKDSVSVNPKNQAFKAKSEKVMNKITNKSAEYCPMNKNTEHLNSSGNTSLYIKNNYMNKGMTNKFSSFY